MLIPTLVLLAAAAVQPEEPQDEELDPLREPTPAARLQAVEASARYNLTRPWHVDPRTVADLSIGLMDVVHAGILDGGDDPFPARAAKWALSGALSVTVTHVAHEYGHVAALSKFGRLDYVLGFADEPASEREDLTLGRLFAQGLGLAERRSVGTDEDDWDRILQTFAGRPRALNRFLMSAEGGGINVEQVIASRYGERLRDGRLSYLDTSSWLWAASGTLLYPASRDEGDLSRYADLVEADGHSTSTSSIKAISALRILGGTGLSAVRGAWRGFFGEDGGFIEPLAWDVGPDVRLHWPEIESWLSREGPTARLVLPARWAAWTLEPSYERSLAGGGVRHEAGVRARGPAADVLSLEGSAYLSDDGGRWAAFEAELRPVAWGGLLLGVEGGRGDTFRREIFGSANDVLKRAEVSILVGLRIAAEF